VKNRMKRIAFLAAILGLAVIAASCSANKDGAKFKQEYEVLNGQTTPDGAHIYKQVEIPVKNPFEYVDGETAKTLITSKTGVLYMGFPECPWCRTLLPALIAAYNDSGYKGRIYYYNALDDRDSLSLSDTGEIVTDKPGAQVYHDLVKILYNYLGPYKGLNDPTIKRIYLPTTVFFKNGAVTAVHLTTIDSQKDGYDVLTDEQFNELKNKLVDEIKTVTG